VRSSTLPDGTQGNGVYIKKLGAGQPVNNHSKLKYLGARNMGKMGTLPGETVVTIADSNFLQDYHSILIPQAIAYSAGILDYFFRGQLEAIPMWKGDGTFDLKITNQSGQDLKGGAFSLYYDDSAGVRTQIEAPNFDSGYSEPLEDGESITASFVPEASAVSYLIVYKGIIGSTNNNPVDLVDGDTAIAAKKFNILRWNITWADSEDDIDIYLLDACTNLVYWESTNSECGAVLDADSYNSEVSLENITLGNLKDGDYQIWVNWYDNRQNSDSHEVPVTLKTYLGATLLSTDAFTLKESNQGEDLPTGVVGPETLPSWYIRKLIKIQNGVVADY